MLSHSLVTNSFDENCYILADEESREACIIDPGGATDLILEFLNQNQLSVKFILATHGHIDHIAGVRVLQERLDIPFYLHAQDQMWIDQFDMQLDWMAGEIVTVPDPVSYVNTGSGFPALGKLEIKMIETPGHSMGSVCYLVGGQLFSGDTLFCGNVGRTDLPGGSLDLLLKSIRGLTAALNPDTQVFPGHGSATQISREKGENPWLNG